MTPAHRAGRDPAQMHRVYTAVNKPLTVLGIDRRLFFLALGTGVATFNLFASLLGGILMFALLYLLGWWASANDPAILRIAFTSARLRPFYDPHKRTGRETSR